MRRAVFSSNEQLLIKACSDAGVVLEFVLIDCADQSPSIEATHRRAAVAAVHSACLAAEEESRLRLGVLAGQGREADPALREAVQAAARYWTEAATVEVDAASLHGHAIVVQDLYGEAFDLDTGMLNESRTKFARDEFDREWALVDAFVCTPYGLSSKGETLQELWLRVVIELLRSPDNTTTMYRWNGDWSPYFDAGREWWGAAAWTIARGPGQVLVACASTTD